MHSTCKPQPGSERLQMSDTPGILESPKSPMCTSKTRSSAVQRASVTGCAARQKTGAFGRSRHTPRQLRPEEAEGMLAGWLWERSGLGLRSRRSEQDKCQLPRGR
jgi:hypothetical protein